MTKHNLSKAVDAALRAAGALQVYVMVAGKLPVKKPGQPVYWLTMHDAGTPDRLAILPVMQAINDIALRFNQPIYVEIKDKGDRLQPSQVERFPLLVSQGMPVYVCSADADDSAAADTLRAAGVIWCHGAEALYTRLMEDSGR